MPAIKLTRAVCDRATPHEKPYDLWDTKVTGLVLRVRPSGRRYFLVQYAYKKWRTVGRYGPITLEMARTQARQLLASPPTEKPQGITLGAFIEQHYAPWAATHLKDAKGTLKRLQLFGLLFGHRLDEIMPRHVIDWRTQRLQAGIKPATVNRDITGTLKPLLTRAVEWGKLDSNPVATVKPIKEDSDPIVRYLAEAEEGRLRAALSALGEGHYLRPMVLMSINTGLRRGELLNLRWEDVDFSRTLITVRASGTKTGRTRHVPMNREVVEVLRQWGGSDRTEGPVFESCTGPRFDNVRKSWAALLVTAGIESFRWHDMRHHTASKLVQAGVDLYVVAEILGHSSVAITKKYAHLAPGQLQAAVEKLSS